MSDKRPPADPYEEEAEQCIRDPAQIELLGDRLLVRCVDRPTGWFQARNSALAARPLKDAQQSLWRVYQVGPAARGFAVGDYVIVNTKINEPYQDVAAIAIINERWAVISTGLVSAKYHPERATQKAAIVSENVKPETAGGIVLAGAGGKPS